MSLPYRGVVSDTDDDHHGREGIVTAVAPLDGVEHYLVSFVLVMTTEELAKMSKLDHPALWFRPSQLTEVTS